jgi:ATP synthase protein I
MNAKSGQRESPDDGMAEAVRKRQERVFRWRAEGEPSMARYVGQIGVLGWIIVAPTLIGLFIGRSLDRVFASGIFWSAALLMLGVAIGFWAGWRWMHRQ